MTKSELAAFIKTSINDAINDYKKELLKTLPEVKETEFFTIDSVAKHFKVTKATIHNWAKKDIVKKYRLRGKVLYKISEIEKQF